MSNAALSHHYRVINNENGTDIDDAFVLRVRKDPAAWLAAWYYAAISYNRELAAELQRWLLANTPHRGALGSEGARNEPAMESVEQIVASPGEATTAGLPLTRAR